MKPVPLVVLVDTIERQLFANRCSLRIAATEMAADR